MSSSIKALASSFGLKRHNTSKSTLVASSSSNSITSLPSTSDELAQRSTPYSSLPQADALPQTDHFTFNPPMQSKTELPTSEQQTPLPGHSLRPGVPAPPNARLSLGLDLGSSSTPPKEPQPTTTIRLISNPVNPPANTSSHTYIGRTPQLKPFKTSFDLIMGSPTSPTSGNEHRGISLWPPEDPDTGGQRLYPSLPLGRPSAPPNYDHMDTDADAPMPGSLSFQPQPPQTPAATRLGVPSKPVDPFIFGSPLPQHNVSNDQFKTAASSVLDEMNKRLQEEGIQGVGMDLISKLQPGAHVNGIQPLVGRKVKLMPKNSGMTEKFEKMHEEEFKKMEGIDGFSKRRKMSPKRSAEEMARIAIAKKRKSVGHGAGRDRFGRRVGGETPGRLSGKVIAAGKKPRVLPGSFDDEDKNEDENDGSGEDEKMEKKDDPFASDEANKDKEQDDAEKVKEEEAKKKEREAIKRKLELNKARRKSSVGGAGARGRVSVGRGGVLRKFPSPIFFAHAKQSIVKPQPTPSRFGFLSSAKTLVQNVFGRGKKAAAPPSAAPSSSSIPKVGSNKIKKGAPPPSLLPAPKKAPPVVTSRPSTTVNSTIGSKTSSLRVPAASRARSPIPPFGTTPSTSTRSSLMSTASTTTSRNNSTIGTGASKASSMGGVSSIGTRTSFASSNKLSGTTMSIAVSSMGSKKAMDAAGRSSATGSLSSTKLPSRFSSRLLAPTASSLAKITRSPTKAAANRTKTDASPGATLGMITNSPAVGKAPFSPRPGGIFSKPLEVPSGIPMPVKMLNVGSSIPSVAGGSALSGPAVSDTGELKDGNSSVSTITGPTRQRSLVVRKPRISRSKVIAKLASQRAASANAGGSSSGGGGGGGARVGGTPSQRGRVRSSLGAKVQRSSYGGKSAGSGRVRGGGGGDVMMSAKKRVRQSEYARRRSRVEPLNLGAGRSGDCMNVDPE
jgi:hypothetical protein